MTHLAQRGSAALRELTTQAVRFVSIGSALTAVTFVLYGILRLIVATVFANLVALAITTVLGAELHRRYTFSGATAMRKRMAMQNLASWAWSSGSTSAGLLVLGNIIARPTYFQETAAMLVVTAIGGVARFAVLRWWVLTPSRQ